MTTINDCTVVTRGYRALMQSEQHDTHRSLENLKKKAVKKERDTLLTFLLLREHIIPGSTD